MKWGLYGDAGRPTDEPPLVYFGGQTETTIFGLGGSTRHVIGFEGATSTSSRSATPYLVAHLLEGLEPDGWHADEDRQPGTRRNDSRNAIRSTVEAFPNASLETATRRPHLHIRPRTRPHHRPRHHSLG